MHLATYKIKNDSLVIDIYHNRAEVFCDDFSPKTFYLYENIGEIMESIGKSDLIDDLILV